MSPPSTPFALPAAPAWQRTTGLRHVREAPLLTVQERAALLGHPWFAALASDLRQDLLRHCSVRRHAHGAPVLTEPDAGARLSAVVSGALRVSLRDAAAPALEYLPPGRWFVDPALFGGRAPLHVLQAQGRTAVVGIAADQLSLLLDRHRALQPALLQLNHDRVAALFHVAEELASLPLARRLANCLLRLCADFGQAGDGGVRIALPLRQDALAELIRVSRQRVNLQLKTLEAQGVLRVGRELVVLDADALRSRGT